MINDTYKSNFIAGIDLLGDLDREAKNDIFKLQFFKKYILDSSSGKHLAVYNSIIPEITKMANGFINNLDPKMDIGRKCHTISDQFNRRFRNKINDNPLWLFLTIGDVSYKGESVYDVSKDHVIDCVRRGFEPSQPLGVHVWLTLEDMTIFDLTIMASLLRLNWVTSEEYHKVPIIVGKSEDIVDFVYTPYLVDNDFVSKVDIYIKNKLPN